MFASDGFIDEGGGHPRTSGTYSKVLGRYVREQGVLSLAEAIRRMTLEPALRLQTRVPEMALKGRIMLAGHADITIFDPETVIDRSTYEDAMIPADGINYVIIAGEVVVDGGDLTSARPGRAIRARTSARAAN
jgi:dihydroorotase